MVQGFNEKEAAVLTALQQGLPLTPRPFAEIGRAHALGEAEVISLVSRLLQSGQARRLGGVFDARRLGYRSALCAMEVPRAHMDEVAGKVTVVRGVTHAYERGWPDELSRDLPGGPDSRNWPNFWFTLTTPAADFAAETERIHASCQPYAVHILPALRRFKIDVVFDLRTRKRDEAVEPDHTFEQECQPLPQLDEAEKRIVKLLSGNVPLREELFETPANEAGLSVEALLERLRTWQESGILRRFALLLRHRKMGFKANGMCCWDLPDDEMLAAGRRLAACPEVTHCYERARLDVFPFRLYAMIHTPAWEQTRQLFERLSQTIGARDGQVLLSLTEFKKTSMQFF
jgi:DNA-binding Lrp family transcriptional regulator